jgi:uncharacterized coiled-coil DUF342 family protein
MQGMNIIGSEQHIGGNVTITIQDMTQTIQQGTGSDAQKNELQKLVNELKDALQKGVPPDAKEDAEDVAQQAQKLVEKMSEVGAKAEDVKKRSNLLKAAAENIEGSLPIVFGIVTKFLIYASKITGA